VQLTSRNRWILLFSLVLVSSGCASSTGAAGAASGASRDNAPYSNILVVAIADNYTSRAQFERTVVSQLKQRSASGTPFYQAAGGNKPVNRDTVRAVLTGGDFDAVLVTRVLSSDANMEIKADSAATKVSRRNDKPVDFFRYNYEELDEPGSIAVHTAATLATNLYAVTGEKNVWSYEVASSNSENVGQLIDDTAARIVRQLQRDKLIAK
jgi:hypothetical protein